MLACLSLSDARSMGNKHIVLDRCVQLQGYSPAGITEIWWDGSHDWRVAMEGYELFRKDRMGRQGGGVALYVREQVKCTSEDHQFFFSMV